MVRIISTIFVIFSFLFFPLKAFPMKQIMGTSAFSGMLEGKKLVYRDKETKAERAIYLDDEKLDIPPDKLLEEIDVLLNISSIIQKSETGRLQITMDGKKDDKQLFLDATVKRCNKLIALDKNNYKIVLYKLANIYFIFDNSREALNYLDEYVKLEPQSKDAFILMATISQKLNRSHDAEISYTKAIEVDNNDPTIFFNRGKIYLTLGNYKNALNDFHKAKDLKYFELESVDINITLCNRIVRQMEKTNLPTNKWKFKAKKEYRVKNINMLLAYLPVPKKIDMMGHAKEEDIESGGPGTILFFEGSKDNPNTYIQNFYVWNGSVIHDEKYGILLNNGTHFKYVLIEGNNKTEKTGIIEAWKFKILSEEKTII